MISLIGCAGVGFGPSVCALVIDETHSTLASDIANLIISAPSASLDLL
ncbi:MAG TPA: hypothetical protein VJ859_01205 [Allosphingosinicella sp.]|nr:hypothetical protein [Allosphingosinicella sp.]